MSKPIAKKHSLDVAHLTSIEYPLNVQNVEKAVEMVGGKEKISKVIKNQSKDDKLELRLRKDPYHHPIESLCSSNENVLVKISIPTKNLPKDFDPVRDNYNIQELLEHSYQQQDSHVKFKATPVAIINKSFSFKSMTDFQYITKNNSFRNEIVEGLFEKKLDNIIGLTKKVLNCTNETIIQPENGDLELPPPPRFSSMIVPYNYKYTKNPFASEVLDDNGDITLVHNNPSAKIHTIFIKYQQEAVPTGPSAELMEKLKEIEKLIKEHNTYDKYHFNHQLVECIKWLDLIFDYKPVWIRKQIVDILPPAFKNALKMALPYVSYVYKTGPWRQSYIRYGYDPSIDKSSYIYQTEAFRIVGFRIELVKNSDRKIVPPILRKFESNKDGIDFHICESFFFNGVTLPNTLSFQIGDIVDPDIINLLKRENEGLLNVKPNESFGWINGKTMKRIRKLIRYKLHQLIKDKSIDSIKVEKILTEEVQDSEDEKDEEYVEHEDMDQEDFDQEDTHIHSESYGREKGIGEEIVDNVKQERSENDILQRLQQQDPDSANKIRNLVGLIKQEHIISKS